jgi:hypothetical protein
MEGNHITHDIESEMSADRISEVPNLTWCFPRAAIYAGASNGYHRHRPHRLAGLKHTVCLFSTITISLAAMISQVG